MEKKNKVICPHCGYKMPLLVEEKASCKGVWAKCKNRDCKKEFEIKI